MKDAPPAALSAKQSALTLFGAEHSAYDAALAGVVEYLRLVRAHHATPDPGLFQRSLSFLSTFMERFHHPKEDEFLFKAVRQRTREADETLSILQHHHAHIAGAFRELELALSHVRPGSSAQLDDFDELLSRYAHAQLEHMQLENRELIPIAERVLKTADWQVIDEAFRANRDPFLGTDGRATRGILTPPARRR